jgi:uncharacterized protein YciI
VYVVELTLEPDPRRFEARPAHRERLQQLHAAGRLVMAGPYADDSGALLVFDVADRTELDDVLDADPYYRTPGVTVARRQEWTPVVGT